MPATNLPQLAEREQAILETWFVEFDKAWEEDALAAWVAHRLPEPGDTLRSLALTELVKIDMERQWQHGRRLTMESYLDRYPELGTTATVRPDLLLAEFQVRVQFGAPADLADFARRFPGQAAELGRLVQEHAASQSLALLSVEQPLPAAARDTSHSGGTNESVGHAPLAPCAGRGAQGKRLAADRGRDQPDLPETFGRYRIIRRLGQGGMGSVYLAHDTELDRQVALKVPHFAEDASPQVVERFFREARAAAALRHPNICPVHDVGEIDGIHYLTMAYIEGHLLKEFIRRDWPLTEKQVTTVVRQLALALQEAHEHGVVHRDLKPANIIIDQRRQPIIMDFGLARRQQEAQPLTRSGTILGTLAYMPPEQLMGDPNAVGPKSDIYSLGVILYELLTGRRPFEGDEAAIIGQILTSTPPPPRSIRPEFDARLERVCLKAMAKKPEDRYGSMKEFAAAVAGLPGLKGVAAEPSVTGSRVQPLPQAAWRRMLPRHWDRKTLAILSALAGLLLLGIVITVRMGNKEVTITVPDDAQIGVRVEPDAAGRASAERQAAPAGTTSVPAGQPSRSSKTATPAPAPPPEPPKVVLEIGPPLRRPKVEEIRFTLQPLNRVPGDALAATSLVARPAALPGLRWWSIESRYHRGSVMRLAYSPDGRFLATSGSDGTVRVWDADSRRLDRVLLGHYDWLTELAWRPDSRVLATSATTFSPVDPIFLWDVAGGRLLGHLSSGATGGKRLAWSPDGCMLACGGTAGGLSIHNLASGEMKWTRGDVFVESLCYSPDGRHLAVANPRAQAVIVFSAVAGEITHRLAGASHVIGFTADGRWLLAHDGQKLRVLDLLSGQEQPLEGATAALGVPGKAVEVAMSSDGTLLADVRGDVVAILDVAALRMIREFVWPNEYVVSRAAFVSDNTALTVANVTGMLRTWDLGDGIADSRDWCVTATPPRAFGGMSHDLSFDGSKLLFCGVGILDVWDLVGCRRLLSRQHGPLPRVDRCIRAGVWSPDGSRFAVENVFGDCKVRIYDARSGEPVPDSIRLDRTENVSRLVWCPDGNQLAIGYEDGEILVWDLAGNKVQTRLRLDGPLLFLESSPDSSRLAAGTHKQVAMFDPRTGSILLKLPLRGSLKRRLAWNPTGTRIAVDDSGAGPFDTKIVVWDVNSGAELGSVAVPMLVAFGWTADGTRILVAEGGSFALTIAEWAIPGKLTRRNPVHQRGIWRSDCFSVTAVFGETMLVQRQHSGDIWLFDLHSDTALRKLVPLQDNQWIAVTQEGHYHGSEKAAKHLVYIAVHDDGRQMLYTPDEFSAKFGWKNDPSKVPLRPDARPALGKGDQASIARPN